MKSRIRALSFVLVCVVLCVFFSFIANNAYAKNETYSTDSAAWNNSVARKALLQAAKQCYQMNFFASTVKKIDVVKNGYGETIQDDSKIVALPAGYGLYNKQGSIECSGLFFGGLRSTNSYNNNYNFTSILSLAGLESADYDYLNVESNDNLNTNSVDKIMGVLGYGKENIQEDYRVDFQWRKKDLSGNDTGVIATRTVQLVGGKIQVNEEENKEDPIKLVVKDEDEVYDNDGTGTVLQIDVGAENSDFYEKQKVGNNKLSKYDEYNVKFPEIDNHNRGKISELWKSFKEELYRKLSSLGQYGDGTLLLHSEYKYEFIFNEANIDSGFQYSLQRNSGGFIAPAVSTFLKSITKDSSFDASSLAFSRDEQLAYYLNVLYEHFYGGLDIEVIRCDFSESGLGSNFISINVDKNGTRKKGCGALRPSSDVIVNVDNIYGFGLSGSFDAGRTRALDFDGVVSEINRLSADMPEESTIDPVTPTPAEDTEVSVKDCMSSGAAGSMAWVICPISGLLQNATEGMYENYIQPMLQIDASNLLSVDDGSTTRSAWETFRNIANTAFIIILLVIIFSQLTGVGIDNYGIKKALPKLIVAAVLINLSYIICTLCVDLSNIVGNGVKNIFDSFGASPDLNKVVSQFSAGQAASVGSAGAIVAVTIFVAVFGLFVQGLYADPSTLIPLILAAIGMLIGVLFLFVMLAARQAAIVCLTVASPIIVVLYVLPNTKRFFDKVSKIFWQLLLVYPICGLLIGGGNFASRLLLVNNTNADFFSLLAACAVGIAPIFFIPQVLTSALNGLGGLGSKIQGLGNRLGSTAKNVIGNSGAAQEARKAGAERRNRFAEGRDYRRAVLRSGQWTDRDGNIHNARNSRFRPLAAAAGLRERAAGSGLGRLLGMDRAMGEAATKQAALGAERNKNRNTFDNMDNVMNYTAESNKETENGRLGRADVGFTALSRGSYRAMQRGENSEKDSKNRLGIAVENQANYDAKQRAANNAVLSANAEGVTVESIDSLRAKQRDRNIETAAQNRLITEEGINVRSENARMIDKIQQVHGVKAEEAAIGETLARARELYPDQQFSINDLAKSEAVLTSEKNNEFAKTFATNETGASEIKIDHEIGRLANAKLQAEKNEEQAVPVLTPEVAEQRAKTAVISTEYKNASDGFTNADKSIVQTAISNLIQPSPGTFAIIDLSAGAQIHAALDKLGSKGDYTEMYEAMDGFNPDKTDHEDGFRQVADGLISQDDGAFKVYGKRLKNNNKDNMPATEYFKSGEFMADLKEEYGDQALAKLTKDSMKHLNRVIEETVANGDTTLSDSISAKSVAGAIGIASTNSKYNTQLADLVKNVGRNKPEWLAEIGKYISAKNLGTLTPELIKNIGPQNLLAATNEIQSSGYENVFAALTQEQKIALGIKVDN